MILSVSLQLSLSSPLFSINLIFVCTCLSHPSLSPVSLPLQGSVWINNRSRIVKSDYTTSDGIIHHIDTLLTPYQLQDKPLLQPDRV